MHIIWWPISLKRVAGSPAPSRAKMAADSRRICAGLRLRLAGFVFGFAFVIDFCLGHLYGTLPSKPAELCSADSRGRLSPQYQSPVATGSACAGFSLAGAGTRTGAG